ncbi:parallel beta helix pectate lyase-like protein [Terracoccus luteus]|uniref:Parallel beta helix pectate lyase-like protein n=1 Tax=Terracoccus luteus TaxID=53356 RepID=A0A495Y119_9MICO|nr:right-handed parallel beta-helix repeat-containing protein [Terracoccus luteus]RKT78453.1 parallel beta helix pectate lyase-like protein [Terracoccus luteus]
MHPFLHPTLPSDPPGAPARPGRRRPRRVAGGLALALVTTGALTAAGVAATATSAGAAPVDGGAVAHRAPRTQLVSSTTGLQVAIKGAVPGDVIRLAGGTYTGPFTIKSSGTASAPITITSAGTGEVRLTANLRMPSCGATSPDPNRTIRFLAGASYWNIDGLSIRGGIMIMGGNAGNVRQWLNRNDENWQARRAVPGRDSYDPSGILASTDYLQRATGAALRPSIGIRITNNDLSLKGVHSAMNKNGVVSRNEIHDIACGTGPGLWLGTFSDGWQVTDNTVHDIAPSAWKHYMQEGIRVGGSSAYNTVTGNTVYNLPGDGRAFTTDEDGSWNTFSDNTARNVAIGFNDQMSGWGNQWTNNRVDTFRTAGISLRAMDAKLTKPSLNSSPKGAVIACNVVSGGRVVFQAGAMMDSTVRGNGFDGEVQLSSNLRSYFGSAGNTWDGSSRPPGDQVRTSAAKGC